VSMHDHSSIAVSSDEGKRLSISVVLLYTLVQGVQNKTTKGAPRSYVSRRAADEPMALHPVNRTQTVA
jgi:hypothetical protein